MPQKYFTHPHGTKSHTKFTHRQQRKLRHHFHSLSSNKTDSQTTHFRVANEPTHRHPLSAGRTYIAAIHLRVVDAFRVSAFARWVSPGLRYPTHVHFVPMPRNYGLYRLLGCTLAVSLLDLPRHLVGVYVFYMKTLSASLDVIFSNELEHPTKRLSLSGCLYRP